MPILTGSSTYQPTEADLYLLHTYPTSSIIREEYRHLYPAQYPGWATCSQGWKGFYEEFPDWKGSEYYNPDGTPRTVIQNQEALEKIYNLTKHLETRIYSHPDEVHDLLIKINKIAGGLE